MHGNTDGKPDNVVDRCWCARNLNVPPCVAAEWQEQHDRRSEAGIVATGADGTHYMNDGVDQHEINGDQTNPEIDRPCQIDDGDIQNPDSTDVDDEDGSRREHLCAIPNRAVNIKPEAIAIVL